MAELRDSIFVEILQRPTLCWLCAASKCETVKANRRVLVPKGGIDSFAFANLFSEGVPLNWLRQLDLKNFSKVSLILYSLYGALL